MRYLKEKKKRSMVPHGGNDAVMTPPELCERIVKHFRPTGSILEPCRGTGNFFYALSEPLRRSNTVDWCELSEGRDFLKVLVTDAHYDWLVTNPPYSKLSAFLIHSMLVADNVVFLVQVNALLGIKARREAMKKAGFGIVEIAETDTPPKPWPSSGFQLAAIWLRKHWTGSTAFTRL